MILVQMEHMNMPKKNLNQKLCKNLFTKKKFDLVSGSRFSKGGSMYSFFHYTCSLFFNYFLRLLLKSSLRDNLGSFFCINKKALKI